MHAEDAHEPHVALSGVRLAYGERVVFDDLSCEFPRGQISVLMGGSGSGKSTLLRLLGGLQHPDAGSVRVAGEEITRLGERQLFRVRQRIGMMFQGGALLDSMTIFENLALPLEEHTRLSAARIAEEVQRRLGAVGLHDVDSLLPSQLSGGMIRRAALARAIMTDPEIVLCDEPFAGLDPLNVRRIEALLTNLNRSLGITMIVASHHIASALRMASRLIFLVDGGAISGAPAELEQSRDARVAHFFLAETDAALELPENAGAPPSPGPRGAAGEARR